MRARPISTIVKTDDEVAKEMKKAKATQEDITAELQRRDDERKAAQDHYDKKTSSPFRAGLQRQNS